MPVTLTPYGKEVRKLRVDADAKLRHMAEYMGVSVAYLSSIEKKETAKIGSVNFLHSAVNFFLESTNHTREFIEKRLLDGLSKSQSSLRFDLSELSVKDRLLSLQFAYRLKSLSRADKDRIADILNQKPE